MPTPPKRIPLVQSLNARDICMIFCGLEPLQKLLILPTMLNSMAELDWTVLRSTFHDKLTPSDASPEAIASTNATLDALEELIAETHRLLMRAKESSTVESSSREAEGL